MHHQVALADHTESPPSADSLLGPKGHPMQALSSPCSMTQPAQPPRVERSIHTLSSFSVDIDSSSYAAPVTSFSISPKTSFTSLGRFDVPSERVVEPNLAPNADSSRPWRLGTR
ncbi:hypothetical protein K443DRAFT_674874 [Laccaria amethystina LaAM-08-1]|uniref:Uncharacterized protein n=1 Tax=Laccaria amethystina LaAM-08-1 TaxID=1095629 RepID=A0A0C9Y6F5_9AGAR|nr:hypothetical protein K443DRAFT_674874 [Laccaria amethystina LaAM-08-1]